MERRARRRRVKRSRILQNNQHFIICAIVCIAVTVIEFVTVIIIIIFVFIKYLIYGCMRGKMIEGSEVER